MNPCSAATLSYLDAIFEPGLLHKECLFVCCVLLVPQLAVATALLAASKMCCLYQTLSTVNLVCLPHSSKIQLPWRTLDGLMQK